MSSGGCCSAGSAGLVWRRSAGRERCIAHDSCAADKTANMYRLDYQSSCCFRWAPVYSTLTKLFSAKPWVIAVLLAARFKPATTGVHYGKLCSYFENSQTALISFTLLCSQQWIVDQGDLCVCVLNYFYFYFILERSNKWWNSLPSMVWLDSEICGVNAVRIF